tara:strand:- start:5304 stop:5537 length:234 start_codon:yes stop_codon:yes gene_type:complete
MKNLTTILVSIWFLTSCSTSVILPGLCYDDRDGTFMCPQPDVPIKIDPIPEVPLEIQEILDCEEENPLNDKECVMIA